MVDVKAILIDSMKSIHEIQNIMGKEEYKLVAVLPAKEFIENTTGLTDKVYSDDQYYALFRKSSDRKVFVSMSFFYEDAS